MSNLVIIDTKKKEKKVEAKKWFHD
jgi:hypothetical protein